MSFTSTQITNQPSVEPIVAEWLRIPVVESYCGLKKSHIYELIQASEIKSFVLKQNRNALRGIRLISKSSLDDYFNRKAKEEGVE
jgi:hypothetical protein